MMECVGPARALCAMCIVSAVAGAARADVTYAYNPTPVLAVDRIDDFDTEGDGMDGMLVTARFEDGFTQTLTWETLNASIGFGGVVGDNWRLDLLGSSAGEGWLIRNNRASRLMSFSIDGRPGDTAFDVIDHTEETPDSRLGRPFITSRFEMNVDVTYSFAVRLADLDPYYDLYTRMDVDFSRQGGLQPATELSFAADTDHYILPAPGPVSVVALLAGTVGLRRRR